MFSNRISLTKWNSGIGNLGLMRRSNSRGISRWIPRGPVLGIEVRGTSLFLACIKLGLGRVRMECFGEIPDFASLSPQDLGAGIRDFLKPLNREEVIVALGLPRSEAIVRLFDLPAAARKSLKDAATLQVELYKPGDTEQIDWDTTILDEDQRIAIALVLIPHATVEKFASLFSRAGYPITRLTLTQFSLLHSFLRSSQERDKDRFLVLDCNGVDAELALLEGKKLVYSRSLPLPRRSAATVPEVLGEIRQAYSSLRWNEETKLTVLASGVVPGAVKEALARFGSVDSLEDKVQFEGLSSHRLQTYLGATAVALSNLSPGRRPYGINLLPARLRVARHHLRRLPTYALLIGNAVLLLACGLRTPVQNVVLLHQYQNEIASLKVRADEMNLVLQKNRDMQQELADLDDFQQRGRKPLDALSEVAQKLPPDAWLNLFSCRQGLVELGGSAKAASPLLPLFQSSPQFQDAKFEGALNQDPSGAERFRLQLRLKEKP